MDMISLEDEKGEEKSDTDCDDDGTDCGDYQY
jgi:hypothetical protein